jgi:hypothetical protein
MGCLCYLVLKSQIKTYYTKNEVKMLFLVLNAIRQYSIDIRSLPNEKNLLSDLMQNPGIHGWNGPYVSHKNIYSDDVVKLFINRSHWDVLQYDDRLQNKLRLLIDKSLITKDNTNTIQMRLPGYDRIFFTEDDIICEYSCEFGKDYHNESLSITYCGGGFEYIINAD